MNKQYKIALLILQIIAWSLLIAFPYLNKPPGIDHYLWNFNLEHLSYYCWLIVFFNLNYFYFVPHLFQKQKFLKFIGFIILSFIIVILSRTLIIEFLFPKKHIVEFRFHFSAAGYLIIAYAISIGFRALQDWFIHSEEKSVLISEKQKAELAILRHQLSPHFLFNTLNNITQLMHKDVNIAEDYVAKLASLLRDLLQKEKLDKISLNEEINFVKNYVALQEIRLSKNNQLSFIVEGETNGFTIEPFILINFIENVFKHGLGEDNKLIIYLKIENGILELITENSKSNCQKDDSTGIGVENVKKRLQIVYPNKHNFFINLDNNTYKIHLKINLK